MRTLHSILLFVSIVLCFNACDAIVVNQNIKKSQESANARTTKIFLDSIKQSCQMYHTIYKQYPERIEDLIHTPDGRSILDTQEPIVDKWNQPIVLEKTDNQIKLYSVGEDGKANTEDDLISILELE